MSLPIPEYDQLDATALAALVRAGELSPEELLDACIARIEARNPAINAVVTPLYDHARRQLERLPEDAPLRGVPFLLKHMLAELKGTTCTMGTRLRAQRVSSESSHVVKRYEAGGLVFVGRTNTPELGIKGVTDCALHGVTRNPWDTERTPGGSSGGAGASVAARIVPAAHGGDGGGSVRIPASHCGLFGLKPGRGRVSHAPDRGEGWGGLAMEHALTRSVRDSALLLDLIEGAGPGDPYVALPKARPYVEELEADPPRLRVAFSTETLLAGESDPACRQAVREAAALLEELGHEVVEARPPFDRAALVAAYFTIVSVSVAANVTAIAEQACVKPRSADFEPVTWFLAQVGWSTSGPDYAAARETAFGASRGMAPFFEAQHDLFLCPTTGRPPPPVAEFDLKPSEAFGLGVLRALPIRSVLHGVLHGLADDMLAALPNTQLFNLSGQPAMSLPLHWTPEGLPVGVQLAARHGGEGLLFQLAAQVERARPWAERLPPGI